MGRTPDRRHPSRWRGWLWFSLTSLAACGTLWLAGSLWAGELIDPLIPYSTPAALDEQGKAIPRPMHEPVFYDELAETLRSLYSQPRHQWPTPQVDADVDFVEFGPVPPPPHPPENPYSKAKADLGQMLFFDPRLSGSTQMACASCHDPDLAWADGRTVPFGNQRTALARNAPSVLNIAHVQPLFWDGRAATLEEQALAVIENPDELHATLPMVVGRLQDSPEYVEQFEAAFGDGPITADRMAKALATYQRTLVSTGRSDFDRFMAGDADRLSDAAVRGLHLFRTAARCANCHHGPLLSDNQFHDLGLSYYGRKFEDLGRYHVTGKPEDVGAFKTPPLRNVTRTAPYMHVGLFSHLTGILNMYNAGMPTPRRKPHQQDDPLFPTKSHLLRPLGLNQQDLADLKAFLQALEEPRRRVRPPELPPLGNVQSE